MATYQTSISSRQPKFDPEQPLLNGWKEIANYLGKGVRTVQRYERELRLPVRRPAGRLRSSVVISRAELDLWVSTSPANGHQRDELKPKHIHDLRRGVSELQRLCAERRELMTALHTQRAALESNALRIRDALSKPVMLKTERHKVLAAEQKARAIEMRESARRMTDQAVEMRKAPRARPIISC